MGARRGEIRPELEWLTRCDRERKDGIRIDSRGTITYIEGNRPIVLFIEVRRKRLHVESCLEVGGGLIVNSLGCEVSCDSRPSI